MFVSSVHCVGTYRCGRAALRHEQPRRPLRRVEIASRSSSAFLYLRPARACWPFPKRTAPARGRGAAARPPMVGRRRPTHRRPSARGAGQVRNLRRRRFHAQKDPGAGGVLLVCSVTVNLRPDTVPGPVRLGPLGDAADSPLPRVLHQQHIPSRITWRVLFGPCIPGSG